MSSFPLHAKNPPSVKEYFWLLQVGTDAQITRSGIRLSGVWWPFQTDVPGISMPTVGEQKQKEALTLHSLDREKHSTLHTCGTKILPGEEDGMVVMLGVLGVQPLLGVCPAAHLLQTPGRIPALYQADGLETQNITNQKKH